MKILYERDRVDNKFKDLKPGELFKFVNKYPDCIFIKCTNQFVDSGLAVNVNDGWLIDEGWLTNLICEEDEIVRVEGVLTIK